MGTTDQFDAEKKFTGRFLLWFSASVVFASVLFFFCITFIPIPKDNIRYADTILGFVGGTLVSSIINFYWGSSKVSKDKDDALNKLVKENNGNNPDNSTITGRTKTIITKDETIGDSTKI